MFRNTFLSNNISKKVNTNVISLAICLTFLMLGMLLRFIAIFHTNKFSVLNMPLADDSYYYFSLGRNIATGKGIRIDYAHLTTGFQPIWGGIVSIPYLFFSDNSLPITFIQVVGAMLGVFSGIIIYHIVYKLTDSYILSLISIFTWLFSPQVIKHNINGMETSLANLMLLVIIYAVLLFSENVKSKKCYAIAGVISGLAVLSRFDLIVLLISIVLSIIFIYKDNIKNKNIERADFKMLVIYVACFLVTLSPWILLTTFLGKPIIPESGSAVRTISLLTDRLPTRSFLYSLFEFPSEFIPYYLHNIIIFTSSWSRQTPVLLPIALLIYKFDQDTWGPAILALVSFIVNTVIIAKGIKNNNNLVKLITIVWLIYVVGMTSAYSFFVLGQWFYDRYGTSISLFFAIVVVIMIKEYFRNSIYIVSGAYVSIAIVTFLSLLMFGSYSWIVRGPSVVPNDGFYDTVKWLDQQENPSRTVGLFQSGLVGYYSSQSVVNLDGKVNNDAQLASANGKMWTYVCSTPITFISDWSSQINKGLISRAYNDTWNNNNLLLDKEINPGNGMNSIYIYRVDRTRCDK